MNNNDLPEDTIIDLSQPGIIHYIYPTGRKPGLMDPNIGGYWKEMSNSNNKYIMTLTKKELDGEIKWHIFCESETYAFECSSTTLELLFDEVIKNVEDDGYWEIEKLLLGGNQ